MDMDQGKTVCDDSFLFMDLKRGYELRTQLSEVTNGLRTYDKISVIFLLCESPQSGLAVMDEILSNSCITAQNNLFYKWLRHQQIFKCENWQNKLVELLSAIQNYRLISILGYAKDETIKKFMPKNNLKTYSISCVRKILYNMCDELKTDERSHLIAMTEGSESSVESLKNKYLEYKLLSWSEKGIISLGQEKAIDLQPLIKYLNCFRFKNFAQEIELIVEKANCWILRSKSILKSESELSEYYEIIDEKNLGLCVIINIKNFKDSLFPKRWGSDKDTERLKEVFTAFGFDVKLHVDLSCKQFINTLSFYAETISKTSSFFVLIILSHGSENIIFSSDSLPLDMNQIEMIFQAEVCPNLIGKPKIFIIQSCQGQKWQKVIQDLKPEIETDNFSLPISRESVLSGPQKGDSMIAWSTVQGFASFRDKYNGSWYIQELCNELWKFGDVFDLVEIFTRVNNNLRSKVYGNQFMVPSLLLSLRAKVQFPYIKENFLRGRKLMLERLIFDKYFAEFLIEGRSPELGLLLKKINRI